MGLKLRSQRTLTAFIALFIAAAPVFAQQGVTHKLDPQSKVWVDGTSTKSDWTVHATDMEGEFAIAGSGESIAINGARFGVRAQKLESGKSTIMDRLMYDALKAEEHPVIRYVFASASPGDAPRTFKTSGKLTLGGETRDIDMVVTAAPLDSGKIRLTGKHVFKMSDFGLQAPVAMFGALRTGDEVTVNFDVVAAPGS